MFYFCCALFQGLVLCHTLIFVLKIYKLFNELFLEFILNFINLQVKFNVRNKTWMDLIIIKFSMINYTLWNFLVFLRVQLLILTIQITFK